MWDTTEQPGLRNSEINNQFLFLPLSLSHVIIGSFCGQLSFHVCKNPASGEGSTNAFGAVFSLHSRRSGGGAGRVPGGPERSGRDGESGGTPGPSGPHRGHPTHPGTPGTATEAEPDPAGGERAGGRSPAEARPPGVEGRAVTAGAPFIICINFIVIALIFF